MSLRIRFFALLACALVLSLVLGCALAGWHALRSVRTELETALEVGEQTIRNGMSELAGSADPDRELPRLVSTFNSNRHMRASLRDEHGALVAQSSLPRPTVAVPRWFRTLIAPRLSPFDIVVRSRDRGEMTLRLQVDATNETGEVWGSFRDTALILVFFSLLLSLAMSWTIGRVLRPFTGVLAGLSRVGAGDYGIRVAETGSPEIAALAAGFNRMAACISSAHAQNAKLQEQLLTLQEEERAELSRELHDEIGPSLFAASVMAATIQHLAENGLNADIPNKARAIQGAVAHVQRHVQDLLRRLRSIRALEFGLNAAVGDLVAFWRNSHPEIAFSPLVSVHEADMGEALKEAVYRIVQESLSNAVRHGHPSRIEIKVEDDASNIVVRVTDNGVGATSMLLEPTGSGFGLAGMRERVEAFGGVLSAGAPEQGAGWTVTARLPTPPSGKFSAWSGIQRAASPV